MHRITTRFRGTRLNTAMLGIAGLVLMVIVGLSYQGWRQYRRANADASWARGVAESVDQLRTDLIDAETGQRGFLLTGETRYLEPYNQAIKAIPRDLEQLERLLTARPGESGDARLRDLVHRKLSELGETVELRRTQGAAAALAVVASDQGKRTMDEIRALCTQIQRRENSIQRQSSAEREAAAETALLVTVAGALLLLFFFAFGLEPFVSSDPRAKQRPWPLRHGAAVLAVIAASLLRMALTPLIGETAVPFITYFPAVLFAAWFGGFRAAALGIVLSVLAADYYFIAPAKTFLMPNRGGQITLVIFVVVGFGMALLSHSQRRAVERADRAENAEREQRQRFETTLASIGDAVLTTDTAGRASYLNPVAEQLTGWTTAEAEGRPLEQVFRIVNEHSRATVENPVARVLREGRIVGLANHTLLIARDGREVFIDDSAAPIRDQSGVIQGAVLVFRDIGVRRRMERELQESTDGLQAALDAGRMGVWEWNIASGKVKWSPNLEAIHGIPPGSFGGTFEAYLSDVHPDDVEPVRQSIARSLDEKSDHDIEYRIIWPDGSLHWIHGKGRVVRKACGEVLGMTGLCMDVTSRKQAEEALRTSHSLLKSAVEAGRLGVWDWDIRLNKVTRNDRVCEIHGVDPATFGDTLEAFLEVVHPEDRPTIQRAVEDALARHAPYELEFRAIRPSGETRWLYTRAEVIRDPAGQPVRMIGITQDVTERRQAEERFHLAVEAAPSGMVVINDKGEIVLVNSYTEKLFGYSRKELIGEPVEILVPERFRAPHQGYREDFLGHPQARPMGAGRDLYGLRKDGSEFPIEIGLNPIETGRGVLVLSSVVDITARREAEATNRLLSSVVESSVEGIISEDLNGIVTSWNRGAEHIFGYSAAEMIGRPISLIVPPGHTDEMAETMERVKKGEAIAQYETTRRKKNGELVNVSATWSPVHDSLGRVVGASKIVRDISERKQLEEQRLELFAKERALASEKALRETEAELARVARALSVGELAASIAHEVNQPLAGVITNAEAGIRWLSGDPPNVQEVKASLELIVRDGDRAAAVIRRIREFLKKESQQYALLDINDVVQEVVALAGADLQRRQVTLRVDLSPGLRTVRGDRIQLQQVLLNLMMNGADAMSSTREPRELLVISQESAGGQIVVAVQDSGAGMNPQDLHRMFDAFFTTKPTGMGMGLSISRSIVEAHDGRIWAELNDGPGLTVQFSLPAESAAAEAPAASLSS